MASSWISGHCTDRRPSARHSSVWWSMMLHCMAHEIVHALLNACSSRASKYAASQQHTLKFHNLIGTIFGHPDVQEKGSWGDVLVDGHYSLRGAWAGKMTKMYRKRKIGRLAEWSRGGLETHPSKRRIIQTWMAMLLHCLAIASLIAMLARLLFSASATSTLCYLLLWIQDSTCRRPMIAFIMTVCNKFEGNSCFTVCV